MIGIAQFDGEQERGRLFLVPVDFSPTSEQALLFAAGLADDLGASIHVLHVVHDPGDAPGYYRVDDRDAQLLRLEDVARDMLAAFLARVRQEHPDSGALAKADSSLVVGLPVSRILEMVTRLRPQMVVMGSAGRTGMSHLMLGSKAEQAVRLCPVPVTIVKAPPPFQSDLEVGA